MFWRFGSDELKPPRRRHGLVEQGVEPAVRPDQRRQRLDVRRPQLGVDPPVEHGLDDRVDAAQLLEHRGVGRVAGLGLAALRQAQLDEQDVAQLLRRADRELVADGGVDLALEPLDLGGELALQRRKRLLVEGDPGRLHAGEDRDQRELDLLEQPVHAVVVQRLVERRPDGDGGQGLEARDGRGRQAGGRGREHEVEALGDDVGDLLRPQRGVDEIGGDLGVEGDVERPGVRVFGEPRGEQRLDVVSHEPGANGLEEMAQGERGVRRRPLRPRGRPLRPRPARAASRRAAGGRRPRAPRRRPPARGATAPASPRGRCLRARCVPDPRSRPRARPSRRRSPPRSPRRAPRRPARSWRWRRWQGRRRRPSRHRRRRPRRSPSTAGATPGRRVRHRDR